LAETKCLNKFFQSYSLLFQTKGIIDNGMFPVYVFDGNPPDLKAAEVQKRMDKRISAKEALDIAMFEGDEEEIEKQSRRLFKGGLISESIFHFV
jgi:flap endonuclease-1